MKIDKATRDRWEKYARLYLREKGYVPEDITDYGQMWSIAFELSIPREDVRAVDGLLFLFRCIVESLSVKPWIVCREHIGYCPSVAVPLRR